MTPAHQLNLDSAIRLAASATGLNTYRGSDGHEYADLTSADYAAQDAYLQKLKSIILANPGEFAAETVVTANTVTDPGPLQNYTVGDAVGDTVDSIAATAQAINPLSTANIATVGKIIVGVAVFLGVVYIIANSSGGLDKFRRHPFTPLPA